MTDASIITLGIHESRTQNFIEELRRRGYQISNFDVSTLGSLFRNLPIFVRACFRSEFILTGTTFPWLVLWIWIGRLLGRPVVVDCPMDLTAWPFPTKTHWRWLVTRTLRAATLVVTLKSRSHFASKFGLSPEKMLYIESSPDENRLSLSSCAVSRFMPDVGSFVICCSGGSPHHRLERFLPIFQELLSLLPAAVLLIIADEQKPLAKLAREWERSHCFGGNIKILPVIKPLEDFYATVSQCDLWVATLGDDTLQGQSEFRMELLEIGLLSKPVVSARTLGIATHKLTDNEDIVFIDPNDIQSSARRIALIAGDRVALDRLGTNLRKLILSRFSLSSSVKRLLESVGRQ